MKEPTAATVMLQNPRSPKALCHKLTSAKQGRASNTRPPIPPVATTNSLLQALSEATISNGNVSLLNAAVIGCRHDRLVYMSCS